MSADTLSELAGQAVQRAAADTAPPLGGCPPAPVNEGASDNIPPDERRAHRTDVPDITRAEVKETSAPSQVVDGTSTCEAAVTPLSGSNAPDTSFPPSQDNGAPVGPVVCRRCGGESALGAARCATCQSWLPANQAARHHGAFARYQPPDLRLDAEALVEQVVADLVGTDASTDRSLELSALERTTVRHLGDVHVLMRLNLVEAIRQGVHTRAGGHAYDRFLAGVDRFLRLGAVVGWKRRAKDISSMSIQQYLEHERQHQQQSERMDPMKSTQTKRDPSSGAQPGIEPTEHQQTVRQVDARQAQQHGTPKAVLLRLTGPNGGTVPSTEGPR